MRAPDFWDRKTDGVLPTLLRPLGCLVSGLAALRRKTAAPWTAPVPVVCVGNLVTGGAGKTPVTLDVAARIPGAHVVTRGYGGHEAGPLRVDAENHSATQVGDEALLLARAHPTWVSRDRRAGIEAAVAAGAQAIVLDDGFQNPTVHKDLSLVVVDGGYGFGNGRVMPAGPLREPVETGLARADAVVLLGADEADVWGRAQRLGYKHLPVLRARLAPLNGDAFKGRQVYAFAGIGRPQKFFDTLSQLGCKLVGCKAFDDHHMYMNAEIQAILDAAGNAMVVTTAKDAVRLNARHRAQIGVLDVELKWKDESQILAVLERLKP